MGEGSLWEEDWGWYRGTRMRDECGGAAEAEQPVGPCVWGEETLGRTQKLRTSRLDPGGWGQGGADGRGGAGKASQMAQDSRTPLARVRTLNVIYCILMPEKRCQEEWQHQLSILIQLSLPLWVENGLQQEIDRLESHLAVRGIVMVAWAHWATDREKWANSSYVGSRNTKTCWQITYRVWREEQYCIIVRFSNFQTSPVCSHGRTTLVR